MGGSLKAGFSLGGFAPAGFFLADHFFAGFLLAFPFFRRAGPEAGASSTTSFTLVSPILTMSPSASSASSTRSPFSHVPLWLSWS